MPAINYISMSAIFENRVVDKEIQHRVYRIPKSMPVISPILRAVDFFVIAPPLNPELAPNTKFICQYLLGKPSKLCPYVRILLTSPSTEDTCSALPVVDW